MKYWSPEPTDSHKKAMELRVSAEKEEKSLFLRHVEMILGSSRLQVTTNAMFRKSRAIEKAQTKKSHLMR